MQKIQTYIRANLVTILLVFLAFGFLMLLAELLLTDHVDGIQLVAVVTSALGLVAVGVGLFAKRGLRVAMAVLLAVLSIAGLIGTFEHLERAGGEEGEAHSAPALATSNQPINYSTELLNGSPRGLSQGETGESDESAAQGEAAGAEGGGESAPPPLAPLSLSGLALMGAVVLMAKKDPVPAPQ